jgi:hypothetical protein
MPFLGDGDEIAQMPEFHGSARPIHIEDVVNQHHICVARRIDVA